ncbi:two-component system histidine kinase PnpS [Aeribacillus alveayuensis]|uniref:histidine kinase n=1 Tax=Aeribacillus alveayuensis TaxID=279215 RepID=A0ABT9VJE9_9BACI|nr:two-component system phosphate regulon sensor histidine kinase PhoR [Bacillus alveayuensis]
MNKFRSRLIFALGILTISVFLALGLILGQFIYSFYLRTFEERFQKDAQLVSALLLKEDTNLVELGKSLNAVSEALESNIILLDSKGAILYQKDYVYTNKEAERIADLIGSKYRNRTNGFQFKEGEITFYVIPIIEKEQQKGYLLIESPHYSLQSVHKEVWFVIIASLGLALVVIFVLGVRITREYTKPIESATKVAIELAKGNYKARTFEDHLDETGTLSQAINILARNLQEMTRTQEMQQDRLQTLIENMGSGLVLMDGRGYINLVNKAYKEIFNIDPEQILYRLYYDAFTHKEIIQVVEEIFMTETKVRKHLLLPLKIERRHFEVYGAPIIGNNEEWKGIVLVFHDITELKKLEQMRKDFVANVSHELKTPITSIKGFTETLLDGAMKDEKTLESFLSIILKESERLQTLIQDLLDLSKIEQQGFKLNIQTCLLNELLEEIYTLLKGKADDKNIQIILQMPKEQVFIQGDLYRLKQIFINLVNNAITYTKNGGTITIKLENKEDYAIVHVIDTGIGIKKEEIPRIFERFYRIDKARSRNLGGTGLGLAIVKHLVEAHKADITVRSQVGKGTTFSITFQKNYIEE